MQSVLQYQYAEHPNQHNTSVEPYRHTIPLAKSEYEYRKGHCVTKNTYYPPNDPLNHNNNNKKSTISFEKQLQSERHRGQVYQERFYKEYQRSFLLRTLDAIQEKQQTSLPQHHLDNSRSPPRQRQTAPPPSSSLASTSVLHLQSQGPCLHASSSLPPPHPGLLITNEDMLRYSKHLHQLNRTATQRNRPSHSHPSLSFPTSERKRSGVGVNVGVEKTLFPVVKIKYADEERAPIKK